MALSKKIFIYSGLAIANAAFAAMGLVLLQLILGKFPRDKSVLIFLVLFVFFFVRSHRKMKLQEKIWPKK